MISSWCLTLCLKYLCLLIDGATVYFFIQRVWCGNFNTFFRLLHVSQFCRNMTRKLFQLSIHPQHSQLPEDWSWVSISKPPVSHRLLISSAALREWGLSPLWLEHTICLWVRYKFDITNIKDEKAETLKAQVRGHALHMTKWGNQVHSHFSRIQSTDLCWAFSTC